jgi:hypothetical protein
LIKCGYEGLHVDNEPIQISAPYRFSTPKHRIELDMIKLILHLQDKNVEITQLVDFKTHRTDEIKIR